MLILGAGAAGMMCAIEAGQRGRRVLLLDHADRPGRKILISGGGRANFTNLHCGPENFLSANPHFAKSALARYTPADFIALVEKHGIRYHEKTLGQLFCDGSAQQLVTMLERECAAAGVRFLLATRVLAVARDTSFRVETTAGTIRAATVVIATGGPSIPKMGATAFGYEIARQFGLDVLGPRPALVPLVFSDHDRQQWCDLTGLSTEITVHPEPEQRGRRIRASEPLFREKMLITHRGLSGPAILQGSSFWRAGRSLLIDLAPGADLTAPLRASPAERTPASALAALQAHLPARLAERWLRNFQPAGWSNAALAHWEAGLHRWRVTPAGTEGFAKAEVTAGGVSTAELDPRSLESRRVRGLFFIGEVVDVTGWLGGYNFQWAWASGVAAGQSV